MCTHTHYCVSDRLIQTLSCPQWSVSQSVSPAPWRGQTSCTQWSVQLLEAGKHGLAHRLLVCGMVPHRRILLPRLKVKVHKRSPFKTTNTNVRSQCKWEEKKNNMPCQMESESNSSTLLHYSPPVARSPGQAFHWVCGSLCKEGWREREVTQLA